MLKYIAVNYPANKEEWERLHSPVYVLGSALRAKINKSFGGLISALDFNKLKNYDTLGVFLRPYMPGDSLKALDLAYYLKTNNLQTRIDWQAGQQKILILVHIYDNMSFKANDYEVNKGQLALCLAGIITSFHENLIQNVEIEYIKEDYIEKQINNIRKKIKNVQHLYIITDLLYNSSSSNASADDLLGVLKNIYIKNCSLCIVRDPLEMPNNLNNKVKGRAFTSFIDETNFKNQTISYYSGQEYTENLEQQYDYINKQMKHFGYKSKIFCGNTKVEELLNFIVLQKHARYKN